MENICIRTELRPGDLGYVIHRHGVLYAKEYGYSVAFEAYVAAGLYEFYKHYDEERDRVWICEQGDQMIGFMLLMHREGNSAQLRYFYLEPAYRGLGLGRQLMELFMAFFYEKKYQSAYLWTTHELKAAASLYTRHGFQLTESVDSSAFGKPLQEQRYSMEVSYPV